MIKIKRFNPNLVTRILIGMTFQAFLIFVMTIVSPVNDISLGLQITWLCIYVVVFLALLIFKYVSVFWAGMTIHIGLLCILSAAGLEVFSAIWQGSAAAIYIIVLININPSTQTFKQNGLSGEIQENGKINIKNQ